MRWIVSCKEMGGGAAACVLFLMSSVVAAEPYAGIGIGNARAELGGFDGDDSAGKVILGYIFDVPAVDLSFEANYVDFGALRDDTTGATLDVKGLDAFAIAGIDFGLVGLFGKAGIIAWDADGSPGFAVSGDGTDSAYGAGVRFNIASLVVRAEYERFDIETADDLDLISASFIWRF